ncbi:uncharacterized protein LOC136008167 [Lathamus discolor]|uniref:uncharacterized protein LOC136008167 n=1 Tax=Lathamus discolor TaxID=678569 RepID=UPI0032B732CA
MGGRAVQTRLSSEHSERGSKTSPSGQAPTTAAGQGKQRQPDPFPTAAGPSVYPGGEAGGAGAPRRADSRFPIPSCRPLPWSLRFPGRMALVLGAVLLAAGAAVPPALPAPRDLARSVLETHGQELRLLKMLGVARTTFDWGTHFSINFTARQPACPKNLPDRRGAGCQGRPGRVQRCTAQVSVFAFLPDVPLSMVECGKEPPSGSTQPRSPGTPRAVGTNPSHPSSSSSSSSSQPPQRPGPRVGTSLPGTPRRPPSPVELE